MALPGSSDKLGLGSSIAEDNLKKVNPDRATLIHGFAPSATQASTAHPLEALERNHNERLDTMNFAMLKNTQGLQAPLKLMMEREAAGKVGRLGFLPSSNLMREVLEGRDEDIGFEDFLNDPSQPELMGAPHLVVERQLGIL